MLYIPVNNFSEHPVILGWRSFSRTLNSFDYWLALWHGLVSRFAVKSHKRLSTWATMMRIQFVYEKRRATKVKMSHALAILYSNNFVVHGQKHKVWVLIHLVRTSETFWDQNWADLVKFSVLQQNRIVYSNSIQETLLSISSKGLGNKTDISCLFVI